MWMHCIYLPEKEQKGGKNKVSMETKVLYLIGNKTIKRSETRRSMDMADIVLTWSISIMFYLLLCFELFTKNSKCLLLFDASSARMVISLFMRAVQ